MNASGNKLSFVFVIDTEQYAGNFERQMCGYCTGTFGDCEVGSGEAHMFLDFLFPDGEEEGPFSNLVEQRSDDHGCARPCTIWPAKARSEAGYHPYNSVGIFFYKIPTTEQIDLMQNRAIEYALAHEIVITGFRLLVEVTAVNTMEEWNGEKEKES